MLSHISQLALPTGLVFTTLSRFQLIELWETFLMQLDADEDGEPFFRPPVIAPAPNPLQPRDENQRQQQQQHSHDRDSASAEPGGGADGEAREVAAVASATIGQEE